MDIQKFVETTIARFSKVRPDYAPPHKTIFEVAKKCGFVAKINGELESARKDWVEEFLEDDIPDRIKVELSAGGKNIGTVAFRWEDCQELTASKGKN